ncbi:MAG: 2-amino-4-hydroxy-6-hydroxymethyldihydropteridine diphosphokinase [Chitinophagaceae bacterium]
MQAQYKKHTAYLIIGSNLDNREENLNKAIQFIEDNCGIITHKSAIYETAPWGNTEQPSFLNQALTLRTDLSAKKLMKQVLHIERLMGRIRTIKMGPRLIDIDIALMDEEVIQSAELILPHPHLQDRKFVLLPLAEIAPKAFHPIFNKTVVQMLKECEDILDVKKF